MLRQAGSAPGLEVRRGKGPAAEQGTAAWPGARDRGHAAAAEPAGVCGSACLPGGAAAGGLGLPVEEEKAGRDALQPQFSQPG